MAQVSGKMKPKAPAAAKTSRGHAERGSIERLNGGGFTTRIHFRPPRNAGSMVPGPEPIEKAHKNYKAARKHLDEHFSDNDADDQPIGPAPNQMMADQDATQAV